MRHMGIQKISLIFFKGKVVRGFLRGGWRLSWRAVEIFLDCVTFAFDKSFMSCYFEHVCITLQQETKFLKSHLLIIFGDFAVDDEDQIEN